MILVRLLLDLSECIILELAWLKNVKFSQIVNYGSIYTKIVPTLLALQIFNYVLLILQLEHASFYISALLLVLTLLVVLTQLHFYILLFTFLAFLDLHPQ